MRNIKRFFVKNASQLIISGVIAVAPIVYTVFIMNDYLYPSSDAKTNSIVSTIDVHDNGDLHFQETRQRYLYYRVLEQDIYFASDHENNTVRNSHNPLFDINNFYNEVTDSKGNVISGNGTDQVNLPGASRYLTYSWLDDNKYVDELGLPITRINDDQGVRTLFHYNADRWLQSQFIYDYWIRGAALQFLDTSELFWTFATTDDMKTTNVDITILLPTTTIEVEDVDVYVKGANRAKIASISKNSDNRIEINITANRLYPDEFIATRINFPKDALTIDATQNTQYRNRFDTITQLPSVAQIEATNQQQRTIYSAMDIGFLTIAIILLGFAIYKTFDIYKKYDKEWKPQFYGEYYRELPSDYGPAIMGYLYRYKDVSKEDVAATLMDLIRRKYIEIDASGQSLTDKKANYTLIYKRDKDQGELLAHEKALIDWFFGTVAQGDKLTLNQLENFAKSEKLAISYMNGNKRFVSAARSEAAKQDFFDDVKEAGKKGSIVTNPLFVIGVISALVRILFEMGTYTLIIGGFLFALGLALKTYYGAIQRRSKAGNEDFVKWQAFKKFLEEFSNIKDYPMPGIIVWEHYMVYAVAFGIADLVEKQLRFKYRQLGMENQFAQSTTFRYPGFYLLYYSSISRSFARAQTTINAAQASRNAARGGRFGGGGGRIGGGGTGARLR
jgi:uncharacterized membrane protein